ncbi:hypothetical protein EDD29_0321 [Actinocorallia herbida]|uniref:Mce-associated membrane protein n=1 Tax=Actinocorallia herbida TaxID=58109 RepID=A0A3N1CND4_9ACTN|nr:hypothetical protein [Actinocorallia herbida]ROO82836.1 hypothetical protein EDD29_0321 [Actinocorallia herbida]
MDLNNDRQRRLLFAGIAAALVVLGLWLAWPRPDTSRTGAEQPAQTATATPPPAPATPPPGIAEQVDPDAFDLYRLLPFGRKDFATAAATAQGFVSAYGTYRFDEEPQTYLDRMRPMVVDLVYDDLRAGASSVGVLEERRETQKVATGSASLDSVRTFGPTSVTFVVTGIQTVASTAGSGTESKSWAVTVQNEGGAWRVFSFAPADVGEDGEAQ